MVGILGLQIHYSCIWLQGEDRNQKWKLTRIGQLKYFKVLGTEFLKSDINELPFILGALLAH